MPCETARRGTTSAEEDSATSAQEGSNTYEESPRAGEKKEGVTKTDQRVTKKKQKEVPVKDPLKLRGAARSAHCDGEAAEKKEEVEGEEELSLIHI